MFLPTKSFSGAIVSNVRIVSSAYKGQLRISFESGFDRDEPVFIRSAVVVQEGDDGSCGLFDACVSGVGVTLTGFAKGTGVRPSDHNLVVADFEVTTTSTPSTPSMPTPTPTPAPTPKADPNTDANTKSSYAARVIDAGRHKSRGGIALDMCLIPKVASTGARGCL